MICQHFLNIKFLNESEFIFAQLNGSSKLRETWVQSQVELYQKLKNWYLMPPCLTLSIIMYGSRVSGAIQGKEWCPPLHLVQ